MFFHSNSRSWQRLLMGTRVIQQVVCGSFLTLVLNVKYQHIWTDIELMMLRVKMIDVASPQAWVQIVKMMKRPGEKVTSTEEPCLNCTFARRRSHPQPRHYAPTSVLDPSPLQDFSLLIRSLLASDAPGSRTFKPRQNSVVHFFELGVKETTELER